MSNVKISFFLKNRKNNLNQQPIVMTITMNKDRTQVFTGIWVDPKKWNNKLKKIKGTDEETQTLNDSLLSIMSHTRKVSNELLISGKPYNPNTIKQKIKEGFSSSKGVVESYEIFLERMKKLIPSKYTQSTLTKYTNTKERVKEFIKHYTQRNDIYLYELESQFMEDFDLWLRKKYNVQHNTIYKTYQRFTRFIRYEISRGNLDKYPFPDYQIRMVVKEGHYLSFEDIQKLENFQIENRKLYQTKLLFLFTIYTGLSFIDLYKSKESDLIIDDDGMFWLKTFRQKSKSRVSVPLISYAVECLKKLRSGEFEIPKGNLLPVKSNVHLNLEIKQVCQLCGIKDGNLTTWHSGRRSTSSLMMKMGIPLQILQKVLSHKSLSTSLMYYTHTDDTMVKESMKELEKKLIEF
ncbi:site-specific integrase, partial [Aquirufa nivalisilvae]|uniref:site-specific integrase n=1 Tax=Aquirufa nivalisilvae TaxID=2516557 RepID=UPI0022A91A66